MVLDGITPPRVTADASNAIDGPNRWRYTLLRGVDRAPRACYVDTTWRGILPRIQRTSRVRSIGPSNRAAI